MQAPSAPKADERRGRAAILARIGLVLAAIIILAVAFADAPIAEALSLLRATGPVLAIALVPPLIVNAVQVVGWWPSFAALERPLGWLRLMRIRVASEAVFLSMPLGSPVSDAVALWLLKRDDDVPLADGAAAVVARKLWIVAANAVYVLIALAFAAGELDRASRALMGKPVLLLLVLASGVFLAVIAAVAWKALASGAAAASFRVALRRIPVERLRSWLTSQEHAFDHADRSFRRVAHLGRGRSTFTLAFYTVSWLLEAGETLLALRLLGVDASLSQALAIEIAASLLRSFAFVLPAGLGVQDASYLVLFRACGVPAPEVTSIAFVVIKRAKELAWILIGFALLALPARLRK